MKKLIALLVILSVVAAAGSVQAANALNPGQMILDTSGAIVAAGTLVAIKNIIWFPSAANDDLLIREIETSKVVVSGRAVTTLWPMTWTADELPEYVNGLSLSIDGGTLYINTLTHK